MRLSGDPQSPDYHAWKARHAKIYLDGRKVQHCRFADEERGCVIVELHDGAGRLVVDGDEVATQMRFGEVKILLPEGPA